MSEKHKQLSRQEIAALDQPSASPGADCEQHGNVKSADLGAITANWPHREGSSTYYILCLLGALERLGVKPL